MDVFWDGKLVDAPTFNGTGRTSRSMGWARKHLFVVATSTTSVVAFSDATPDKSDCGATLDSVSLVQGG